MKKWKQLDYLETNNKDLWKNIEYSIKQHKGEILLELPRDKTDIKELKDIKQN